MCGQGEVGSDHILSNGMADSDATARAENIEKIVAHILGDKYHWRVAEYPPLLGPAFPPVYAGLLAEFCSFNMAIRNRLESLSDHELGLNFDSQGVSKSRELKAWQDKIRFDLNSKYSQMPLLLSAGLGRPGGMANVDYWSKMAFLTIDEVLWLSVGLEPGAFQKDLQSERPFGGVEIPRNVFLLRRQEQLKRGLNSRGYDRNFEGAAVFDWVTRVGLEIHPHFREILRLMIAAIPTSVPETTAQSGNVALTTVHEPDRREIKSLSTLILAMAIDHYGFDPDAGRSTVPKEIANLMAGLGLDMSQETVLKYLRMGRHFLPKDWKPVP